MFQNRWGALFFAGATLIGVGALVGTEDTEGAIASATAQFEQQGAEFREQAKEMSRPTQRPPVMVEPEPQVQGEVEFVSDEDLIVDPVGIDPTPIVDDPAESESAEESAEQGESGN